MTKSTVPTETLKDFIKGQGYGVAPSAVVAICEQLLAVREAQSVPTPIAFSENSDADTCRTWAWERVKDDVMALIALYMKE